MTTPNFDPKSLGRKEVGWWRAHHVKDMGALMNGLVQYNTELYGLNEEDAQKVVQIMVAAVKDHDEKDWNSAVAKMADAYSIIKSALGADFDPVQAAELEVGWWKLHDDLEFVEDKSPLALAFANVFALVFGVSPNSLVEAGRFKAEATRHHDLAEAEGASPGDVERHWQDAEKCLVSFYEELKKALV